MYITLAGIFVFKALKSELSCIQNRLGIFNESCYKFYRIGIGNEVFDEAVEIWIKELFLISSIGSLEWTSKFKFGNTLTFLFEFS